MTFFHNQNTLFIPFPVLAGEEFFDNIDEIPKRDNKNLKTLNGNSRDINRVNIHDLCTMQDAETKEMLADLIWLNAVIATELIQITENTSAILRKSPPPESCLAEHQELRKTALEMAEKYRPSTAPPTALARHLLKHQ